MAVVSNTETVEIPIAGMDCAECARHVQTAIGGISGVENVTVLLAAEKAVVELDPSRVPMADIRQAVADAGYRVPETIQITASTPESGRASRAGVAGAPVLTLLGIVVAAVLFIVVAGEGLGLFGRLTERVPFLVGMAVVLAFGYPVFRNVLRAVLHRQVIAHTLMTVGVIAALVVGQWATAAVVVFFMRVGDFAESFTTERSRRAVRDLLALAPQSARIERDGVEQDVPLNDVQRGEIVVVRPGEQIPIDGQVISGQATVDQAAITGESLPVEIASGAHVYAASFAQLGSLRVRVTAIGRDTTFGRVIRLVEGAEANRADVQRIADRFATWFLPIVLTIAATTLLLSRDLIATAAVLVVACSCSLALATPIAMLATVGAAAKRGLIIKGGRYVEILARADVLLIDKTGTLTFGQPQITDIVALDGSSERDLLAIAATAERYSEHPLAAAVRRAADERGLLVGELAGFVAVPGEGVRATIDGNVISIGNRRMIPAAWDLTVADDLEHAGKTVLFVARNGELMGLLAAADTLRSDVPAALQEVRRAGIQQIELLTGDNDRVAAAIAGQLGVAWRANLLPEDKIGIVREYQAAGHRVVMVGDGVNDAPALAQADVGIAMGAAGSDIAIEAAHVVLMREDWSLVPDALRTAGRTMGVVRANIAFTAIYNVVGLSLAAFGILPPILAAAAQSLPDVGILANSSRLLRDRPSRTPR